MKWKKKANTELLFGIIIFWLVLSTLLWAYHKSSFEPMPSYNIDINATIGEFEAKTSGEAGVGILEVFSYIGMFFKMLLWYTPVFDNIYVTAAINITLWSLRLITLWIILRLIRGGG